MTLSEDQERVDQYIAAMGNELGPAFMVLSRKLTELHIVWQQYRQLYGDTPDTIEILNRTAGLFFKIVQDQLWDSVLLAISRMTDPAEQGGRMKKKNLTIQSLPALIADEEFRMKVQRQCDIAIAAAEYARDHRNKRIAHQDHGYATNGTLNPLNGVSRARVEEMLKALRDVMNLIDGRYRKTDVRYELFNDLSGARVLVSKLKRWERLTAAAVSTAPEAP